MHPIRAPITASPNPRLYLSSVRYLPTLPVSKHSENESNLNKHLGGPGAGKGTQCARLASDLHLVHISAGDLLRERKDQESPVIKRAIERAMALGDLVPPSVVMPILKKEIGKYAAVGKTKILLDGFPRDFPQAEAFMKEVSAFSIG